MSLRKIRPAPILGLAAVAALPLVVHVFFAGSEKYYLHLLIQILLWSFIYTAWSLMGRFGLTSLGHGASPASAPTPRSCCGISWG
jgi:branched-chain amino acid transport system permease protein